jgi:uncharacterized protein (UPF0332 family)
MDKDAQEALQEANALLSEIRTLNGVGLSTKTAINRLYYACFHATKAVLYERGYDPQTHKGVKVLLGRELVQPGDITNATAEFFVDLSNKRERADYEYQPVPADVDLLLDRTAAFIETMEELVEEDDTDT